MNISKKKFVALFLISAFAFQFISNSLFGSDVRLFPQKGESLLGTDPQIGWKSAGYKIQLPIKIVLMGPMLLSTDFLRDDPPPPFVAAVFALYWSILALFIYYLIGIISRRHPLCVSA
ncbi:MAG: hypothetical protein A2845_01520 [Candidatus Lloydbacteria bacterium RIFCSPHIGHO2_01_FULL_49_22]|uniref:DUF5658 domain-containing protein n=1 Tax=Candidatus Lloydbacteria bacterium RIFCSPHIGHO2_01_FULL_49_22 TaxID=1798658 RepID=A0A1G2CXI0_9BACT|nr:MAG: hypothetical protein A2845_01520 [Candidatus Lloydbacteria bacterium RIFCSPHIGHO2_01_FULL_49_22]OGZ09976.1 MAG: hypothetical protein A3C14_04685 [Candidatus Lloydbacteria bacterium RIFCSPHIGHO2_02_FULL_50_18]